MMSYRCLACGWTGDTPACSDTSIPAIDPGFAQFRAHDNTHIPCCPQCGRAGLKTDFKESR